MKLKNKWDANEWEKQVNFNPLKDKRNGIDEYLLPHEKEMVARRFNGVKQAQERL